MSSVIRQINYSTSTALKKYSVLPRHTDFKQQNNSRNFHKFHKYYIGNIKQVFRISNSLEANFLLQFYIFKRFYNGNIPPGTKKKKNDSSLCADYSTEYYSKLE